MKALPTQFDDHKLSNAVATPSCCSCCCCCCCLATSISASSLLAQRIAKEGEKQKLPNRGALKMLAGLFVPIVLFLVYLGYWTINSLLSTCEQQSYGVEDRTYDVCTNPGAMAILPLLVIAPFLVLWYLYSKVHIKNPRSRAVLVTTLIAIAFTAEFIGGALLILTGIGGIVYLILVPFIIGWISLWYRNHIGKEISEVAVGASGQTVHTVTEQQPPPTEQHEKNTPTEPPQQNPPATSSQ